MIIYIHTEKRKALKKNNLSLKKKQKKQKDTFEELALSLKMNEKSLIEMKQQGKMWNKIDEKMESFLIKLKARGIIGDDNHDDYDFDDYDFAFDDFDYDDYDFDYDDFDDDYDCDNDGEDDCYDDSDFDYDFDYDDYEISIR
jgi:hypothetical protein